MSQTPSAEASDPNSGRIPLPDLVRDDELAIASAAAVPALPINFNLSNNFISEDSSRVGPGEAPLEAPGSQTVGALTMLPPSQSQQASRLHSRSEITLLNRDEVRELTPIAAAAAHQDRGLAVRRATSQLRSTNTNREGRDVRDYQFRPSQQQRGLDLFALEPERTIGTGHAPCTPHCCRHPQVLPSRSTEYGSSVVSTPGRG